MLSCSKGLFPSHSAWRKTCHVLLVCVCVCVCALVLRKLHGVWKQEGKYGRDKSHLWGESAWYDLPCLWHPAQRYIHTHTHTNTAVIVWVTLLSLPCSGGTRKPDNELYLVMCILGVLILSVIRGRCCYIIFPSPSCSRTDFCLCLLSLGTRSTNLFHLSQ